METKKFLQMDELDLSNKRVMIREDLNVPMHQGRITDDTRITAALPTIKQAIAAGARVLLLSHLGRPDEGVEDPQYSLEPVADALSIALGQPVLLCKDWLDGVDIEPGQVVLAENVRFNRGEKSNDETLARRMGQLCDIFVMDAFATAHRVQASTTGVAYHAPVACAGPLLAAELKALAQALEQPKRPLVAVVGGSKVSTKIQVLRALIEKVDCLLVGGGIANTFLAAAGSSVGASLYEPDWVEEAKAVMALASAQQVDIPLPMDVRVAQSFSADAAAEVKTIAEVAEGDMILDVGPETAQHYPKMMMEAGTIVWNGPVGVFEFPAFMAGTQALGEAIAQSSAFSIAGGGDTLAALAKFELAAKISYISTGGGAFLDFLHGQPLPAVAALAERAQSYVRT